MGFREIVFFAEVVGEVEEEGGLFLYEEFPIVLAEAFEFSVAVEVEHFGAWRFGGGVGEEGGDVEAVDFVFGGEWGFGESGDGGEEVENTHEFIALGVGGDAGAADDEGDAGAAFEGGDFSATEGAGVPAVMFEVEGRAVVGSENDVSVFFDLEFTEGVHDAADFGVDLFDDLDVGRFGIGVVEIVRNINRDVGHGVGKVGEEGLVFVLLDEVDGAVGVASGDGSLVDGELDDFRAFDEGSFPLGETRFAVSPEGVVSGEALLGFPLVVGVVHVVGVGDAEVVVETVGEGEGFGVVAEVPFAEGAGGVALGLEVVGDSVFGGVEAFGVLREENPFVHAEASGIAAGHEGGTGGGAEGLGNREVGEFAAFFGEAVEVRGLDGF